MKTTKRQDTRKESEGAEFLVLGMLLIRGLPAFKDYRNTPGYDLIVADFSSCSPSNIIGSISTSLKNI